MLHNYSQDVVINCAQIYHLNKLFIDQFLCKAASRGWDVGAGGKQATEKFKEDEFVDDCPHVNMLVCLDALPLGVV